MDFNEGWLFKSYCTRKASLGRHFVSLYDWWLADMNGWNTSQTHWNVDLQATSSNITCYSDDRHEPLHYSGWHITSDCSAIVIKVKCFPKHDERWLWMSVAKLFVFSLILIILAYNKNRRRCCWHVARRPYVFRTTLRVGYFELMTDFHQGKSGWDSVPHQEPAGSYHIVKHSISPSLKFLVQVRKRSFSATWCMS